MLGNWPSPVRAGRDITQFMWKATSWLPTRPYSQHCYPEKQVSPRCLLGAQNTPAARTAQCSKYFWNTSLKTRFCPSLGLSQVLSPATKTEVTCPASHMPSLGLPCICFPELVWVSSHISSVWSNMSFFEWKRNPGYFWQWPWFFKRQDFLHPSHANLSHRKVVSRPNGLNDIHKSWVT